MNNESSHVINHVEGGNRFTQVTRFSWPLGLEVSIGVRPVMSSRSTTPNEYTSVLSFTFPYMKYSGARYLPIHTAHIPDTAFMGSWV